MLVMAALAGLVGCDAGPGAPPLRPNLVLVTIDTLRADALGARGSTPSRTPQLDALAADGVRFKHSIAAAPWTLPSLVSLHTGLPPRCHGVSTRKAVLGEGYTTLAEVLRDAGYRTIGVVSHRYAGQQHGFAQGFDHWDQSSIADAGDSTSEQVTAVALRHVGIKRQGPFFLWAHYFDPHTSYVRHAEYGIVEEYEGIFGDGSAPVMHYQLYEAVNRPEVRRHLRERDIEFVRQLYAEEVAHTDRWVGALFEGLMMQPDARPLVAVVTSDHGEYFMERGRFEHGWDLYQPLVRVPLLLVGDLPRDLRGRMETAAVGGGSVPHTLARLAGIAEPPFDGPDLLDLVAGAAAPAPVFSEGSFALGNEGRSVAVVHAGWKLIHHERGGRYELFDLATDPAESHNRWSEPEAARRRADLKQILDGYERLEPTPSNERALSPQEEQQLEALGYLE